MPKGLVSPDGKLPLFTAVPGLAGVANSHSSATLISNVHKLPSLEVMPCGLLSPDWETASIYCDAWIRRVCQFPQLVTGII